jgi:hypothetical protein
MWSSKVSWWEPGPISLRLVATPFNSLSISLPYTVSVAQGELDLAFDEVTQDMKFGNYEVYDSEGEI